MFFYLTSRKFRHKLNIQKLSESSNPKWLEQIAKWVEDKWGYVRGFPGMEYRTKVITAIQNNLYVVTYANQPIGMFALFEHEGINEKIIAKELMYFYIDESFRGLGIGSEIVKSAKKICQDQGANMMVLDTLNPNLNHFYEKCGAKVVCEGELLKHPTSVLRM